MSTSTPPSPFVLVAGIDTSSFAAQVLASATANVCDKPNARLHLVHALDLGSWGVTPLIDGAREYLDEMAKTALPRMGKAKLTTHLALRRPWKEIVQLATNVEANLIVVGTHGRTGLSRALLGSEAELVVRRAPCPVLVVRAAEYNSQDVPEIEPACPECVKVQRSTGGDKLWCERHSERHPRPHRHYEFPESFALGSMLTRPE
jgi:nucleotide-binding universal stress UspA family protein